MSGATHINAWSGKKVTLLKEFDKTHKFGDGATEVMRFVEYMKHGRDDLHISIFQKPLHVFDNCYITLKD